MVDLAQDRLACFGLPRRATDAGLAVDRVSRRRCRCRFRVASSPSSRRHGDCSATLPDGLCRPSRSGIRLLLRRHAFGAIHADRRTARAECTEAGPVFKRIMLVGALAFLSVRIAATSVDFVDKDRLVQPICPLSRPSHAARASLISPSSNAASSGGSIHSGISAVSRSRGAAPLPTTSGKWQA